MRTYLYIQCMYLRKVVYQRGEITTRIFSKHFFPSLLSHSSYQAICSKVHVLTPVLHFYISSLHGTVNHGRILYTYIICIILYYIICAMTMVAYFLLFRFLILGTAVSPKNTQHRTTTVLRHGHLVASIVVQYVRVYIHYIILYFRALICHTSYKSIRLAYVQQRACVHRESRIKPTGRTPSKDDRLSTRGCPVSRLQVGHRTTPGPADARRLLAGICQFEKTRTVL